MNNSEYWAERFVQIEDAQHRKAGLIAANIYDAYERAKRELNKKITLWYARFAENNDITLAEAKRWLASKDLEEFRWDVWDYIQHGEENAIDQRWMKELENASARVHVSKYEALKIQMRQSLEELAAKYEGTMQEGMSETYQSSYYHTAYELQRGVGVGFDITGVDQNLIEKVLAKPWAADGLNFSERIWKNKQLLVDTLDKELTQGLILGKDPQKVINAVSDKMDVSKSQAGRLVMTESAYFGSEARKDCFKELDIDRYIIVATLDNRTSETCREMDGKVFNMSEYQIGVTAPPFHINCRTTTAPYFEDMQGIGERAARDEVTGKTYTVPRDMKYGEWKERFVEPKTLSQHKGTKVEITKQAINKVKAEKIQGYSTTELEELQTMNKNILRMAMEENDSNEVAMLWERGKGMVTATLGDEKGVDFALNTKMISRMKEAPRKSLVLSHNHPSASYFSCDDISIFMRYPPIKTMEVVTNKGKTWHITKRDNYDDVRVLDIYQTIISENIGADLDKIVELFMKSAYTYIERNR